MPSLDVVKHGETSEPTRNSARPYWPRTLGGILALSAASIVSRRAAESRQHRAEQRPGAAAGTSSPAQNVPVPQSRSTPESHPSPAPPSLAPVCTPKPQTPSPNPARSPPSPPSPASSPPTAHSKVLSSPHQTAEKNRVTPHLRCSSPLPLVRSRCSSLERVLRIIGVRRRCGPPRQPSDPTRSHHREKGTYRPTWTFAQRQRRRR